MLAEMLRSALVLVAAALGVAGATPRSGKVVRVERRARTTATVPRWCDISPDDDSAICRGPRPAVGDTISIVALQGIIAELRIVEVVGEAATCRLLWKVRARVVRGDLGASSGTVALVDPTLDQRSRLVPGEQVTKSPSGRSDDEIQFAVDRNGDGRPDVIGIQYMCNDAGKPDPSSTGDCYDVYAGNSIDLQKVHPTLLPACQLSP
jgi:hypothetical protein